MLHTEPSFSVYADEGGLINIEKGGVNIKEGSHEFSFPKNLSDDIDSYKKMVDEYPANPVLLKTYAHLLQSNGDLKAAEDYYFRATQANPKDGETLMQYAKLIWDLHHHQDRASAYFEAAILAAPENPYVHAAYASFLWEIDEDCQTIETSRTQESLEIDENCCDPLILRNHAQYLLRTKGDLQGAEAYYIRALKADPGNSELASECAQLVWELHRNQHKASAYFQQALQAAPNSHVLAAYAKFLWEVDDEEDQTQKL